MKKTKKTLIEKYGVTNIMFLPETIEKIKNTNLLKYGVEYSAQSEIIKEKTKLSNLNKYGYISTLRIPEIIEKSTNTMLEKYNAPYYQASDISKKINKDKYKDSVILEIGEDYNLIDLTDVNNINIQHKKCNFNFIISQQLLKERIRNGNVICLICNKLESFSDGENSLKDFIEENNIRCRKDRTILNKKEIDIFCEDYNIAFEYNGLYWHSDQYKDEYYHFNKYNECLTKQIRLLQIWEDDWKFKKDIIKSIIKNVFKLNKNKIGARKCILKEVSILDSEIFLNKNHIDGNCISSYRIGLYYNEELVSIMIFGQINNYENSIVLLRFCSILDTTIIGSASKILNYFKKTYNYQVIKTYTDNSLFSGDVFRKIGFDFKGYTEINYYWINKKNIAKYSKNESTAELLIKEEYLENKNEDVIMLENGYLKIWGVGKKIWEYKL